MLYVGRVERTSRWKGLQVLVESLRAAARARARRTARHRGRRRRRAAPCRPGPSELGVAELIDWHGQVAHDELPRFYQRAGVTVLPSLTESESFGMTLVEAMASGCPVVGSAVGGIPFVIRDNVDGLLVAARRRLGAGRRPCRVLTDPATAAALGAAGREAALGALGLGPPGGAHRPDDRGGGAPGPEEGDGLMERLMDLIEALRRRIPRALLPAGRRRPLPARLGPSRRARGRPRADGLPAREVPPRGRHRGGGPRLRTPPGLARRAALAPRADHPQAHRGARAPARRPRARPRRDAELHAPRHLRGCLRLDRHGRRRSCT